MKPRKRVVDLLTNIGLSGLEADVYLVLLEEPGATGYRAAQMTGKLAPNVYKALDSLRTKGAVVMDESTGSKTYVALPIGEYLNRQQRELESRQAEIEKELADMPAEAVEQGMYKLTTVNQVYERSRAMIAGAKSVVLLDAFPTPLAELSKAVKAAANRGVKVLVKTYEPTSLARCDVIAPDEPDPMLKTWNGDWLNVVVDSAESVQSFLVKDGAGVHAAAWCRNRYLAMLDYNGMSSEFLLTSVIKLLKSGSDAEQIKKDLSILIRRYLWDETFTKGAPESWMIAPHKKRGRST